jgi:two-component system, NarL family, nitrate/nitrite response regulator NarL
MERAPVGTVLVGPDALTREGLARILGAADFNILASASRIDESVLSSLPQTQTILLIIDVSDDFHAAAKQTVAFKRRYPAGRVTMLAHRPQMTEVVSAFRAGANAYFAKAVTCDTFIKSLELVMLGETILPPAVLPLILDQPGASSNARRSTQGDHDRDDYDRSDECENGNEDEYEVDDYEDAYESDSSEYGQLVASLAACAELAAARRVHTPRLSARQQSILRCLIRGDSNRMIAHDMNIAEATVKVHVKTILRKIRVHNRTQAAIWAINNSSSISVVDELPSSSAAMPVHPSPNLGRVPARDHNRCRLPKEQMIISLRPQAARRKGRGGRID